MNRIFKNVVMIFITIVSVCGLIFTYNYYNSDNTTNGSMANMDGNTPPDMSNGETGSGTPPEKPSGESENNTPPEKPSGDNGSNAPEMSNDGNENTPPDKPGENNSNAQPEMNNNQSKSNKNIWYYVIIISLSLIISLNLIYLVLSLFNAKTFKEVFISGDKVVIYILLTIVITSIISFCTIYFSKSNNISNNGNNNIPGMNNQNSNVTYSANKEFNSNETVSNEEYTSSNKDENAILISDSAEVSMDKISVEKTGDSESGDNTSFYGTNSGILAKDNSKVTITNGEINTNATGANGVFAYGSANINISDTKITTSKDASGGIMVAGGGTLTASNLTVETAGVSSASIRSDKGGGTLTVTGGTYKTTGAGSPSIYSTANITVKSATLTATASEGVVIEGKNSVNLENVTLTDTNNKLNGKSTTYKNIFLYQSMSGDADTGTSEFTAKNSKITTNKGDTFYVTNTDAIITLENNTFTNNDSTGNFLRIQKDSWGTSGSNGGNVTLNLKNQNISGNIAVDSISTLDMSLSNSSYYEGIINSSKEAKSITLKLSKNSKIKLLGDSYVTSLDDEDSSYSNIDFNGYKLYVNGVAIN